MNKSSPHNRRRVVQEPSAPLAHYCCALAASLALILWPPGLAGQASAQSPDPAVATAVHFNTALISSMHHDTSLLSAAVGQDFNSAVMASFIVGPTWGSLSQSDQSAVAAALRGYLAARFADAFDDDHGEHLVINPAVQTRGEDKLVTTDIAHSDATHSHLAYRMRAYDGHWRIIDVFLDGVSQLTTQRADLATIAPQGANALVARLDAATRALNQS